jgi:hypothetical protein
MRFAILLLLSLAFVFPAPAQSDFLTADEADRIREAQEPDLRIGLYVGFAKQRMDLLDQLFAQNKVGRSSTIHAFLEQLTSIMETLDVVIDDALRRQKEITTLGDVAKTARDIHARLEKHLESSPADLGRYKFALETAIETIHDSAELAEEDLRDRIRGVEAKQIEQRKERDALLTPEAKEEAKKADEKKAADDTKAKKRPSLMRKGETSPSKTGKQ